MALTGLSHLIAQDVKNGNADNFNAYNQAQQNSGNEFGNSNYNEVRPGSTANSTYPVENYNIRTDEIPESVINAQRNLNMRSLPTQEYANQVQADLIADYHGYKTDKNYKGKYTSAEALQGYDYLSRANNGSSDLNWAAPKADDQLFTHIAPRWDAAREINEAASNQFNLSIDRDDSILRSALGGTNLSQAQKDVVNAKDIERGDWNALNWIDKAKALFVPGSSGSDSMANLPSWAKYITNIFPSIMASGAGAAVGSAIAPGIGTGIGALTVGGLSYIQGVTGHEIPVINELLYGMDILSIWTEKAQGAIGAASKETWKRATEDGSTDLLELGRTMGEVLKDLPDLWEVSELSYEIGADLGLDNTLNAIRNAGATVSDSVFGTEFGTHDTNTVSRANIGIGGLIDVNPETRGYDALYNVYMPLYQKIRDEAEANGYDHKEAGQLAMQYLQENVDKLMGTTGLANDFGASAILDPMNLAPYIQAKSADIIANKTGDTALKAAAQAALEGSSPIVDMFSVPILEQVAEFITGKHSTQGLDTIRRVYTQELQSKMPVEKLSDFQKRIAGITNDGVIKTFQNETNPILKWFGLTEEAKMYKLSELTSNLLGSIMFDPNLNTDIASIPELISQFAGISPITEDSPLAQFQNSAIANTLKQTMSKMTADDIAKFQKQIDTFRQYNSNRIMLNLISEKLGMKVDEIFNYIDNPEKTIDLYKKIKEAGITWVDPVSGMLYNSAQVTDALKVFANEGASNNRPYYSADYMKAHIMEEVFKKAEAGMFERYPNIKPDKWYNRLDKMMNSAQSIALLNFSPSYFVNNAINNILTRSVVGAGGSANGKIKTANERRGLSFTRDGDFYGQVSDAINAKHSEGDGLIQRAKQTFDKIADNKLLKGFNNIDIETLETQNAFNIGANRYWDSTWKPGLNLPEVPKEWKALGFTDEMSNTIYKVAMDSATLAEFKQKIGGEIILPGAKSTFFDMLKNNYSETNGKIMENLFSAFPWISDKVDAALQTGDPKTIEATFDGIINEVTNNIKIENIKQIDSEFDNLVTLFAGSGISEMASNREALFGAFCDIWINQSKDSENLFAERILKNLSQEDFDKMYEAHMQRMQADYNMIRKYEVMHTAAMIAGLGLNEDVAKSLMIATLQQFDLESKYIDEEHKLFQKYIRGDTPDFDYYRQANLEMCQKVLDMKQEASRIQEQIIIDYLKENLDPVYTGKIEAYEDNVKHWLDLKQKLNVKEMEWLTERLNDPDIAHKDKVERIDPMHNQERRIYKENLWHQYKDWVAPSLQELQGCMEKTGKKPKIQLDVAQTLAIELMYREAHITEQNTSEFLSHFIDKSDPQKIFDPINFANNMEGTFIDNAHRNASPDDLHKIEIIYNQGDAVPLGAKDVRNRVLPNDYIEQPITGETIQTTPITESVNPRTQLETDTTNKLREILSRQKLNLTAGEIDTLLPYLIRESGFEDPLSRTKSEQIYADKAASKIMDKIDDNTKAEIFKIQGETGNQLDNLKNNQNNNPEIPQEYINAAKNKETKKQKQVSYKELQEVYDDSVTSYKPFKENFKQLTPQNPGEHTLSQVRSHPFIYGDSYARAGVYYDGKLIAYITDSCPDTIDVSGYSFPVIGKDINNPDAMWVYVSNEPTLITPGHPKDVDYTIFAQTGEHPMRYGTLPTTEPWGMAAWETSLPMREALNHWKDTAIDALFKSSENGSFMSKLTSEQQKIMYDWMNSKLNSAYNYQRFASNSYGNTMVDLSLLNYNDRHGYDSILTMIWPYQYWITRSVMNWGARMIDQPKWFSMYARMNKLIERNKRDFLPTRLTGMIGIPLPFLPEGLGSALYFDPTNQLLPMKQFFNFSEYFERNLSTIMTNSINKISELYENQIPYNGHMITREEYQEATLGKGDLFNQVFMETMASDETNTGLSGLVGSLINPNMLVSSALAALAGKQEYISYTPMYKLGNTIRSAGRDTVMENVTNLIGNTLQFGEKKWREMLGAETNDIGSQWVDYWTTRYLADMLFDKKATRSEVINAIAEGESNPLWQEAYKRYSASEAYKQVGGAFLNDAAQSLAGNKETSVGNLAGTALASLFGGRTYSSGEEEYRREYALRQKALGNDEAMSAFYKNFPDYKVMGYSYIDNPAERLHKILVDQCNEAYYALPKVQQEAVYNGLGRQFQELFINSDTRATDQIEDYTLIEWTLAMQGNTPNISNETINKPLDDALQFQYYTDSLQGLIDRYERDKKKYFPGIDTIEQGYFDSKAQDTYKALHPELQKYWDWKEEIGMANPELGTYFAEKSANNKVKRGTYKNITDAIYSSFADNKGVISNLKNAEYYGFKLQPWVENKLKIAYTNLGITSPSYEQWINALYEDVKKNGKITK